MANNRLYIRCKQCGKSVFIGKHFADTLKVDEHVQERLNDFYSKHFYCGKLHYNLELCEEFPLEMTDNPVSVDGTVTWYGQ